MIIWKMLSLDPAKSFFLYQTDKNTDVTDVLFMVTKACRNKPSKYSLEEIYHYASAYGNYIWV